MQQDSARSPAGVIEAHLPFLRRYARALISDRDAADALVRDCLERAVSRLDDGGAGTGLRVWLLEALHRAYAEQSQKMPPAGRWLDQRPGESTEAWLFRSAFDRLAVEDRQILLLTGLEGLTSEEASKVLGIDPVTARRRTVQARQRLCLLQLETGAFPAGMMERGRVSVPPISA